MKMHYLGSVLVKKFPQGSQAAPEVPIEGGQRWRALEILSKLVNLGGSESIPPEKILFLKMQNAEN